MHHYLHDRLSLDTHRMLAERLRKRPELLVRLKARLDYWDSLPHGRQMKTEYRQAWLDAVEDGIEAVCILVTDDSDRGQVLRSCSPFGALWNSPRERLEYMLAWRKKNAAMPVPWKGTPPSGNF